MIVLVYGYDGSGPGHWQRWLEEQLREQKVPFRFPELSDPLGPQKDDWVSELAAVVAAATRPVTFVAHSLGCWAVDHFLNEHGSGKVHAALMVAPPSPHLLFEPVESFLPPPRNRQAWASIAADSLFVNSDDDDFASSDEIAAIAADLGVRYELLANAGHINTASGYGPWPFALEWARTAGDPS